MERYLSRFVRHELRFGHSFWSGRLPDTLAFDHTNFETLWQMHPAEFHVIKIHGRLVKTPRWQQAYGTDYHYTGRVNKALPIPLLLEPIVRWSRENVDPDLNGILLNWYDGRLGHYIGRHRDSVHNIIEGAPIVTISFGEERIFRLRSWPARPKNARFDFPASNGTVFVMPWNTNLAFTHEVPASSRRIGKRVSITLRAFVA